MALFLCLDTSTKACSVALVTEDETLCERNLIEDGYMHAEKLHVLIKELFEESQKSFADLSAVAVGKGPGSYTGLRIGVSASKGFAFGCSIPLIAIPTLQTMCAFALEKQSIQNAILRPMLDARRMEVYSTSYSTTLDPLTECQALLLEEDPFEKELSAGSVYFFGDGMDKAKELLGRYNNARFIDDIYPNASAMRELLMKKWKAEDFENTAYFEPYYLKDFVAKKSRPML